MANIRFATDRGLRRVVEAISWVGQPAEARNAAPGTQETRLIGEGFEGSYQSVCRFVRHKSRHGQAAVIAEVRQKPLRKPDGGGIENIPNGVRVWLALDFPLGDPGKLPSDVMLSEFANLP